MTYSYYVKSSLEATVNILLLEDDGIIAFDFSDYIESLGHTVVHVRNSKVAIEVIDPIGTSKPNFDAIITDMHMDGGLRPAFFTISKRAKK